jgi:hypothetical protein
MTVMPANSTGWFWHCLARETGKIGHLFSPDAQRGPWPWMPYALDNGAFAAWDMAANVWDESKWDVNAWRRMIFWAQAQQQQPLWAIVPDWIGDGDKTIERWHQFVPEVPFPRALAVQDGMTAEDVQELKPDVICVGGTTEWKWATVEMWAKEFPRVHVLRVNSPSNLDYLESLGIESCDGTGWNRGNKNQTMGLELWARENPQPRADLLTPFTCRQQRDKEQMTFA